MGNIIELNGYFYAIRIRMIYRRLFEKLKAHLPKKEFTIILGARQTGKSTLLRQLELHCKKSELPTSFFNLENKSILVEFNEDPLNLLKYLPDIDKRFEGRPNGGPGWSRRGPFR